jgi:hypothetical protein
MAGTTGLEPATSAVTVSRTRHIKLWVGLWVGNCDSSVLRLPDLEHAKTAVLNRFCRGAFGSYVRLALHSRWPPCHRSMIEVHGDSFSAARDSGGILVGNRRSISTSRRRNVKIYLQDGKRPQRALTTPCPNARPKGADPLYQTAHSRICRP